MAGRLRSPSDPSGTQRKRPKAPTQFFKIEESRLEEEIDYPTINDELGFGQWYHDVEEDLLDASHEAYQYVRPRTISRIVRLIYGQDMPPRARDF
jgi:conserved oligomeric Golgi complex subunit 3